MVNKWIIFMKMAQWENTSGQGIVLEQVGNYSSNRAEANNGMRDRVPQMCLPGGYLFPE